MEQSHKLVGWGARGLGHSGAGTLGVAAQGSCAHEASPAPDTQAPTPLRRVVLHFSPHVFFSSS